jgi:cytochrome c-type biogenesis protein CcmH
MTMIVNINRRLPILLVSAVLVIMLLPALSRGESLDDQVNEISHLLMCPVCQGQSVAESNSNLAHDMRQIIRKQLEEGKSKDEVIAYFVKRYGETILASPPPKGVNWLLWILPGFAIVLGGTGIGIFLYKLGTGRKEIKESGIQSAAETDDYMKRLDEELKRHES